MMILMCDLTPSTLALPTRIRGYPSRIVQTVIKAPHLKDHHIDQADTEHLPDLLLPCSSHVRSVKPTNTTKTTVNSTTTEMHIGNTSSANVGVATALNLDIGGETVLEKQAAL